MIELKTERLILRPLCTEDLYSTNKYSSRTDIAKYMIFLPHKSLNETLGFLIRVEEEWSKDKPEFYEFAICLNGVHIGAISLMLEDEGTAELGWIIDKKYQGNGYCTECALALVDYAKAIGIRRLYANCDTRNVASENVMKKIGMRKVNEGVRLYRDERGKALEYRYELELS